MKVKLQKQKSSDNAVSVSNVDFQILLRVIKFGHFEMIATTFYCSCSTTSEVVFLFNL